MVNYIKWDLKDYFSNKSKTFIAIAIVFALTLILPLDFPLFGLIFFAFCIILFVSTAFSFLIGTKRVIDSFKKKTFLLESMIPLPVNSILLAKYCVGFVINLVYSLIGILGLVIILMKGNISVFEIINDLLEGLTFAEFIKYCFNYIFSILMVMSVAVMGNVISKVISPSGKGVKLLSFIIWITFIYFIAEFFGSYMRQVADIEMFVYLSYITISAISYFVSSWLISNKLEIYN